MCNNKPASYTDKYSKISRYAVQILKGVSLEQIAENEGMTVEELIKVLKEIEMVNPMLFKQLAIESGLL